MKNRLKLCVLGASGRMGSTIISEALESNRVILHSVSEMKNHKWVGRDIGKIMNGKNNNIIVSDNFHESLEGSDAAIDFTRPANTVYSSNICANLGVAHIIGTTGFNENQEKEILTSSSRIPIVKAGNMSLGINMLTKLVEKVTKSLDLDFDVEILEMHHRNKIDAPSGTALMLGKGISTGKKKRFNSLFGKKFLNKKTFPYSKKINFNSIRKGQIIGEHEVKFSSGKEIITLNHEAFDRALYSEGALTAAKWIINKKSGLYSMRDLMNFK